MRPHKEVVSELWPDDPREVWEDALARGPWYLHLYRVSRRYGGPEEGGWWYDHQEPVWPEEEAEPTTHGPFVVLEDAHEVQGHLRAFLGRWHGGMDWVLERNSEPEERPGERPHYE